MANSSIYNTIFKINNKKGGSNPDFYKLLDEKKYFLGKVFSNLIFQLLVTFIIAFNVKTHDLLENKIYFWGLIIATFVIIIILSMMQLPPFIKFILFTIFSIIWGLLLSKIKETKSPEIIKTALVSTLSIFISMFVAGLLITSFGIQLGYKFGMFLLGLLILVIIVRIVTLFMGNYSTYNKGIAIFTILLFSVFIIYDTNMILRRDYFGDFITASIDYYLDILNIFVNMIAGQSS